MFIEKVRELIESILGIIAIIVTFFSMLWLLSLIVQYPALFFIILAGSYFLRKEYVKYENYKQEYALCPHGIKGGKTKRLCDECRQEEENYKKKLALELAEKRRMEKIALEEKERKQKIKDEAVELRRQEKERLVKLNLVKEQYLFSLSPNEFEDAVASMFRHLGYNVTQTPRANDGGKDAIMYKEGKKYVVECKRYGKGKSIGRPALQKFFAAMFEENAEKGYFVTTAGFASTAIKYARDNNIVLINLSKLIALMKQAFPEKSSENVRVKCLECGSLYVFALKEKKRQCSCGNWVTNDLSERLSPSKEYCDVCDTEMHLFTSGRSKIWVCNDHKCRNMQPWINGRHHL